MKSSNYSSIDKIRLMARKEMLCSIRNRSGLATTVMFGVTVLSCISLSLGGAVLDVSVKAALFWIVLFFTFMLCMERTFSDEAESGTLLALRTYGDGQSVLLGKLLFNLFFLLIISAFMAGIYIILMDCDVADPLVFLLTLMAGSWGVAASGTLISSLSIGASGRSGIFAVLMLPIILPLLLFAILLTSQSMGLGEVESQYLMGMVFYDAIVTVGASVLFDYVW